LAFCLYNDYVSFINKIALKKWGSELSPSFYKQLFSTTELHPYYINLLCGRLYTFKDTIPTENDIKQVWRQCLLEEKSKTAMELSKLSLIQKKLLISIANAQHSNLTSKETLKRINASSGAIVKGIKTLISKDYVFEHATEGYQIVDPLIKSSIQTFFHHDELI
jgi:hypothetical protein